MFLNAPALSPSTEESRYDYIQSAEAAGMEKLFAQKIIALIVENTARVAASKSPFNILDCDIAGGGDGHTFVVRFLLSTAQANPGFGWNSTFLSAVQARCWMGSDAEALGDYQEAAIASLSKADPPNTTVTLQALCAGTAGASKGTRFMAFLAAIKNQS
jgi:hypothetical protein